jgi:hypothetical protein
VQRAWKAGIVVVVAAATAGVSVRLRHDREPWQRAAGDHRGRDQGLRHRPPRGRSHHHVLEPRPSFGDHIMKPDVVAPGNRIISLAAPGSYLTTQYAQLAAPAERSSSRARAWRPRWSPAPPL